MTNPEWTPFERVKVFPQFSGEEMERAVRECETKLLVANSRYQVHIMPHEGGVVHLSIKRHDRGRVGPERYRDFMRIRDELIGPEFEAVEIYPPRSQEVDTANQYHLWVLPAQTSLPFGFRSGRHVVGESFGGAVQEPFEEGYTK